MLEFQSVVFQYDSEDFNIIDGLSFHLEKGEFVSVIGPSGCGKSTIFRLTNQLLPRRSGEILVDGKSIDGRRGYCGYMPQRDLLFPWRTVNENRVCRWRFAAAFPARRWTSVQRKRSSTSVWLAGATSARRSFPAACVSVRHSRVRC